MRLPMYSRTALALLVLVSWSCGQGRDPRLAQIRIPIFSQDDFPPPPTGLLTYDIKANMRPPFWPGNGDFTYSALRTPGGGIFGAPSFGPTYFYLIDGLTIEFTYSQSHAFFGLASGARAIDAQKHVCAEAKLVRLLRSEGKPLEGVEIQEYHYDKSGNLVFTCRSRIETGREWKVQEMDVIGKKERDYFPIWPISRHH